MQNPLPILDGWKTIIAALSMIAYGFYGTEAGWHDPSVGWEMLLTAAAVLGVRDKLRRNEVDARKRDDEMIQRFYASPYGNYASPPYKEDNPTKSSHSEISPENQEEYPNVPF